VADESGGTHISDDPDLTLHAVLVDVSGLYAKSITSGWPVIRELARISLLFGP
jgi:hypothetical protein